MHLSKLFRASVKLMGNFCTSTILILLCATNHKPVPVPEALTFILQLAITLITKLSIFTRQDSIELLAQTYAGIGERLYNMRA